MNNKQKTQLDSELLSQISKKELKNTYKTYGLNYTKNKYGFLGESVLTQFIKDNKITRTKEDIQKGRELVNLEKFGAKYASQSKKIKEKTKQHFLDKFGVENPFQNEKIKDKIKKTNKDRYGIEHNSQTQEHKNKVSNTWKTKSQNEIDERTKKIQKTSKKRYGVDNVSKLNITKKKIAKSNKETCIKKYGVDNISKLDTIKNKIRENVVKSNLSKYGKPYISQVDSIKEKSFKNNQKIIKERYGVEYACLLPQCKLKGNNSKPNKDFAKLLSDNNIGYSREFSLEDKSFDFYILDTNILVEVNPTATHNSTWGVYNENGLCRTYHRDKSQLANKYNYRCICIWDWDDKDKIINLLKRNQTKIYARQCEIKEVEIIDAVEFINTYHLQNYAKDKIRIGLYYKDELVSIMTFDKPRYNKKYQWELIRYCSSYNVVGGVEKLFTYFKNTYKPKSVISYCDLSKFDGNTYIKLGFQSDTINISKHWYNTKTKIHITDNLLRQRGYDQLFKTNYGKGTSNKELMLKNGFVEIYDCGQATYGYVRRINFE